MADESKAAKEETPTYHRDRLVAEAGAFFDQPPFVVEGALSMARNPSKVNYTRDEVEKLIKQFLDHEVETDHPPVEAGEE